MEFSQLIKEQFNPCLQAKGFTIGLEDNTSIEFKTSTLLLRFYHNKYESSMGYFLKHKDFETEFENHIVEEFLGIKYEPVFGLSSGLENLFLWIKQRKTYFISNEKSFLDGDFNFFRNLNEFLERKSKEYTNRFI